MAGGKWWSTAVFYEVYVPSYTDGTDSGMGDLVGIRSRLDHLVALGVDAVWLTPFYETPMADNGYDVADPRAVDPRFGTLDDFDGLVADAHAHGLRVVVDIVPNHVSSAHPWFTRAAAAPGDEARSRFHIRDGRGRDGEEPPNNWRSTFGGPAWTRLPDGQWYLHLFSAGQPDLDWSHPDVAADAERTLRFWLDRGVDGFRIDVAHGLVKAAGLPDDPSDGAPELMAPSWPDTPMWNQPAVHDIYRRWRAVCDEYPHEPVLVGEVWVGDPAVQADYVRPGELDLAFNFRLLFAPWEPHALVEAVETSTAALARAGAPTTWVLSNHDVTRHPTRYGGGEVGRRRARAALLLVLALPGPVVLYQGEELGLEEVELPDEALRDPVWEMSGHTDRGRDGCRVPLPWRGEVPSYGFSSGETTWLPQPGSWAPLTVEAQDVDDTSMLAFYRQALAARPRDVDSLAAVEWHSRGPVLDFVVTGTPGVRCVVNLSDVAVPVPDGELLLASDDLAAGQLLPDAAVWLAPPPTGLGT